MKFKVLLGCVVLALAVSACRRKPAPTPVSVEPLPPQPAAKLADGTPIAGNEAEMALSNASVLTMMLQEFVAKNGRLPNNVQELSAITTFGAVPRPPAGYRFEIDGKKKAVIAVKQ
ncbi:MAG: hypothetical protein FD161_670 [Limisphaerales bacterium]|nr:MAG: hypothetical protein FD161_670 [Limisphaerales bacterium]KAG0510275.1 MAG: hypothetical protein E1N63_670 [Limisphaerales bacterium]TXT51842.1 MAG: hypothetical protein FD140_1230 [Limisphaerales bacterium]